MRRRFMEKKMMKSNGAGSRSSAMRRRRLFSAAAVLLAVCLVFVGAAGAAEDTAKPVAKNINSGKTYTSIQAAVEEAANEDTILVTESHTVEFSESRKYDRYLVGIYVNTGNEITIDLNGKMVMFNPESDFMSLLVTGGSKLTLQDGIGGGKLEAVSGGHGIYSLLCLLDDESEMLVKSGDYIADAVSGDSLVYASIDEAITIQGGNFYLGNLASRSNDSPWIFNVKGQSERNIIVQGGTFNADINHQYWKNEAIVPENLAVSDNGDGTWTVVPAVAYVWETIDNVNYPVGYATVDEAVSKLGQHTAKVYGDTIKGRSITLLEDADIKKTLEFKDLLENTVFYMGGHKLIWKGNNNDNILTVSGNNKLMIDSFDIIREGYTITKWKLDGTDYTTLPVNENGQVEVTQSLSIAEPPEPNKYTVAFDANDGDGRMDDQEFTYDVPQSLTLNAFTKTGYTFTGWKTNPNGSESVYTDGQLVKNLTTINNGKVTLYANWTINQYTITFATDGGSTVESITQDYGTDVTAPADPTKDGYTFAGWDKEIPVTMPAENLEITAIWKEIPAEEEIITPPSSGGGGDGGALSFPRFTENGGLVDFGSSKVVKALMLPEGSSGSVLLKVDTVEKWPKALDTEYTFDISVEKLGDGMAYIHFEIPVSTLESLELTPADICAYHFEGEVWTKLPTTYEVKDGTVCYEAETDSFSPFKLVIEEGAATQKEEENVPTVPPTETPDVPDEPEILPPIDEPTKPTEPTEPETPAPILAVLAGLGAAVIVRRK